MDALRIGITAMAVIVLFKFLFVGMVKVPGLTQLVASV